MGTVCGIIGFICPQVDAFYYPDRHDLTVVQICEDVGTVENCRDAVFAAAARSGDPEMRRGDYECGVGPSGGSLGDIRIYEETVR